MKKMLPQEQAKKIVDRYQFLKNQKSTWNIHYQVLAEYFMTRKADFTINFVPGMFLNRDLYDATGVKAGNIAAGALLGMLWPEESENFEIVRPKNISDTQENRDYYTEISRRLRKAMNHPEAGLMLALGEYMRDEVFFGTCGLAVFKPEDPNVSKDCHFVFQAWDIKRMVIDEGAAGFVNRVFYEREETIENAVKEFGEENMSRKTRDTYKKGDAISLQTKIIILHAIEPRYERDPDGVSVFDLPVSSIYIELGENHQIKESGYDQMQVFVGRLMKNIRETYGRSFAMDALPDELEANALREMEIIATEKLTDPPLGVLDDGRLGATTVDTSAGAISVFNVSGRLGNQQPVFPLNTVGDIRIIKDRLEELKQSISDHFLIDRLLDLNNEVEMTAFEVNERQKLRAYILNPYFSRQITEVFSPIIHCCFNMELKRGHLGVMPLSDEHFGAILNGEPVLVIPTEIANAILQGQDVYDIHYLTPAARMMKAQLASGILNTWKFMNDIAQTQPEVYDNVDEDMSVKLFSDYSGAPAQIIRSQGLIDQIRAARAQKEQEMQQFQQQMEMAKAAGSVGKLMPRPGAPGVENSSMQEPVQVG